jgi:SAM-dependent methyltransferase
VVADAEDLPFPAGAFDVVLSCIGAMFAPDQERTAAELLRVCRPGGTVAVASWTPGGYGGAFFGLWARHAPAAPPAPGAPGPPGPPPAAPTAWGEPDHVRRLLGDGVTGLRVRPRVAELAFTGAPEELFPVYRDSFGPVVAVRAALVDDPAALAALDDDLLELLRGEARGEAPPYRYAFDYLVADARRT